MKLEQFEKQYDDFYVPTSVIKVGGLDIVRDLFLAVTSTQVEHKLNAAGRFSFTVASAFDWKEREFLGKAAWVRVDLLDLFAFGAPVEVSIGYGEPGKLKPIIKGIVTEIGTSFAESGTPALTISGYDALYELGLGTATRQWVNTAPSGAVRAVAGANSLPVKITATDSPIENIQQTKESDQSFINRMAGLAKSIFFIRGGVLNFGPRRNEAGAPIELAWGEGLSSFSPTANLARQVSAVEVHGWSAAQGKHVVGKAGSSDEQGVGSGEDGSAKWAGKAIRKAPVLSISAAVHTQEEADARAKAILVESSQEFVTGTGECVGLPELLPDSNVAIKGVGRAFSKPYYITESTHSVDSKGYRTRFSVKEPGI